ncbi:hypothetical protein GCM10025857_14020 [Alicyclobacillus contaminans]|nr:hypothetical protein GCM10025857_14020 [Alicyclobacillus contaminans]
MWKRMVLYVVNAGLVGLLAQQILTTSYLGKIDVGLRSSLQSTKQLSTVESSIIQKNHALAGLADTTRTMREQLAETLQVTQSINQNIHTIDNLNAATLNVNQLLVGLGHQSQAHLSTIAGQLSQLTATLQQMNGQLNLLSSVIQADAATLHDMRAQTAVMNSKVPG